MKKKNWDSISKNTGIFQVMLQAIILVLVLISSLGGRSAVSLTFFLRIIAGLALLTLLASSVQAIISQRKIARRQQAETELEEQHSFLSQVIDAIPNEIFVRDRQGCYALVNTLAAEYVGLTVEELTGALEAEVNTNQAQVDQFLAEGSRVMDSLEPLFLPEEKLELPDGRIRWHQVSKLPLLDPDGTSNRVLVVLVDITRKKLAEEALKRSEAQYRAVVEDHPGFIYRYKPDLTLTFVNKTYCDFFGFNADEVVGRSLLDVIAHAGPENMEKARQQLARLTPDNPVSSHEHMVTNAVRGEESWVRWIDRLLLDENGEPFEYQASGLDITDHRLAEDALKEQHSFMRQVIDAMPSSIYVRDYSGRYLMINNKMPFGPVKIGEVVGENLEDSRFTTDQARHFLEEDRSVMDSGKEQFIPEEELVLPNGKVHWQTVHKMPLFGPDGRADRVLVVLTDITERKKIEASMVVADKLAGLGTLAAGIAHEINSPLQIITGKSESLKRRLERDQLDLDNLDSDLESINRNGWRVARIVRSLLDYAHPISGEIEQFEINALISDTLLLIEHQLRTWSNITVMTDLASDLPPLYCSGEEVSRLLINLLTNARDAMPDGGEVAIRTCRNQADDGIILEIADNGQGIPEEALPNIFNPFFTTKAVGQGTGLGLFIVHGIVQSLGGEISVTSQVDKGTTFTVSLPPDPLPAADIKHGRY
jgi:PAS domain S-box-containing protein